MSKAELDTMIREELAVWIDPPEDDDVLLELTSLALVAIIERLEDRTGIRVRASEVVPEHFGTIGSIRAFVEGKRR
jgi:acyl carrier protein